MRTGDWRDPNVGSVTLRQLWVEYSTSAIVHVRPTTKQNYRAAWKHVAPRLGDYPANRVTHAMVQAWVTDLTHTKGPATVRTAYRVLSLILDYAVRSERLRANPAKGVRLPRAATPRQQFLTVEQVRALADALGDVGHDHVLTMAYAGLRWSELAALRGHNVDLANRRLHIVEGATEAGGRMVVGPPKSAASRRSIAIPRLLTDVLDARINALTRPDDLLFPATNGQHDRVGAWRRRTGWDQKTDGLGLGDVTPHTLRHTYASLARAAGADLRLVQTQMGHADLATTARVYAHIFPTEADRVADALDRIAGGTDSPTDSVRTRGPRDGEGGHFQPAIS